MRFYQQVGERTDLAHMGEDVVKKIDPFRSVESSSKKTTLPAESFDHPRFQSQSYGFGNRRNLRLKRCLRWGRKRGCWMGVIMN